MKCETHGKGGEIDTHVFIPVASERLRMKIRRFGGNQDQAGARVA